MACSSCARCRSCIECGLWHVLAQRQTQTVQERLEEQAQLFTSTLEQRLYSYADYVRVMRPLLEAESRRSA